MWFLTVAIVGFAFTMLTGSGYGYDIMNALREQNRMNAELHERRNEPMRPRSNDNTLYTLSYKNKIIMHTMNVNVFIACIIIL